MININLIFIIIFFIIFILYEYENFLTCSIIKCKTNYSLSNNKCCSIKQGALTYNTDCSVATCNSGYILSNGICCSTKQGALTYNTDCNILTYIPEDPNKVRIYGQTNYLDLIGNFSIGTYISDRLIYSAKIPSNL